jgi:DNA-binding MarR family transcriptional regulator
VSATIHTTAHEAASGPAAEESGAPRGEPDHALEAVRALTRLARVMERAVGDLSLAHLRVLSAVASGDERASRVADRLALGKPTVSASVEVLCARSLLSRSPVAGDQRAVRLELTGAGRELLERSEQSIVLCVEALAARTGRRDEVIGALAALGAALDEAAAERSR